MFLDDHIFIVMFSVPGPVMGFKVKGRGSTYFDVEWQAPEVVNGILIGYTITFRGNTQSLKLQNQMENILDIIYWWQWFEISFC